MSMEKLTSRETAQVLASLRYCQEFVAPEIFSEMIHFDGMKPLSEDEVNDLCENINITPTQTTTPIYLVAEGDLAQAYADAHCKDCANGKCEVRGDHDRQGYWDLSDAKRESLMEAARTSLAHSIMGETMTLGLRTVVILSSLRG